MKKIICLTLTALMLFSISVSAAKVYDYSGDIPQGDVANFYDYPIARNATRISPWFVRWARQKQVQYNTGVRGGDGDQMIMALAVSPVNPDHLLLGSDMAGIWRSTDGGINWETIGGNNNNWCVNDFEWSPYDEDVAFAVQTGTRSPKNADSKANFSSLDGLYKTEDAGKTWRLVLPKNYISMAASNDLIQYDKNGNLITLTSEGLFTSKDNGETWEFLDNSVIQKDSWVYALYLFDGDTKKMLIGVNGGLYYTDTNGKIWENKNSNVLDVTMCTSVTVDPDDENHWYACFQGPEKTLYETRDFGKTWSEVYYRINDTKKAVPQVIKYGKKTDGTSRLFLITNQFGNPLQYTDDGGRTWVTPKLVDRDIVYNNQGKGYFTEGIAFDKTPGIMYYSFADQVYKSVDGGESFVHRNGGYSAINTLDLIFDNKGRIWFCDSDRGLARSNKPYKKGEYSTIERVLTVTECPTGDIDPFNNNHLIVSCKGVYETFDEGVNWEKSELFEGDVEVIHFHNKVRNFVYAGNKYSTNNGKTWNDLEYEIFAVSPVNNDVVYSADGGVLRKSKDRGKTWIDLKKISNIYAVMADCFDEDTIWYTNYSGKILKLSGESLTEYGQKNGLRTDKGSFVTIMAITQNPHNPKHLVAGGKNTKEGLKSPGIYETYDGGENWRLVPGMKGIAHISSLHFSPFSEEVFIGTCSNGFIIYDYKVFDDWYNGKLTSWDMSDEYIIPNMYKDGRIRVKIDSDVIGFDSQPFLENDRTFVPMRKIFEKLGATIEWDEKTETVTGTKGDTVVKLTIGSNIATINGVEKTLDAVPQLKNDRTMIPLRFVAEALGCKVDWNDSNNLVIIKSK